MREKLIELIGKTDIQMIKPDGPHIPMNERFSALFIGEIADHLIANGVTVLPCKIGDTVWAIRNINGVKQPQNGIVGEMFYTDDMRLCIVVRYIARGEWGKKVFATREEAEAAIGGKDNERKAD